MDDPRLTPDAPHDDTVHPAGSTRRPRRLYKYAVAGILVVAALLTCLTAVVATPGTMPDEDAHYAYIKHLADNYGEFPIDYGSMFLYGRDNPNPATHPPLYYYVMASAYRLLQPNRHFTAIVREKDQYVSSISRDFVVPILRVVSCSLVFLGFLGVYRLCRYLVRIGLLKPWWAVAATALMSFVPEMIYLGGSLNNDVAVLALWPFIVLYSTKYYLHGRWPHFWKAVFLLSAGILTKRMCWILVLGCGILVLARLISRLRSRTPPASSTQTTTHWTAKRLWSAAGTTSWALLALSMAAAAFTNLVTNFTRYGSAYPEHRVAHAIAEGRSLPPSEEKPPSHPPRSFLDVSEAAARRLTSTTFGYIGHVEYVYPRNSRSLVSAFRLSLIAIVLALAGYFVGVPPRQQFKTLLAAWWAMIVGFYLLVICLQYQSYKTSGEIAVQGRFFIGYFNLLVLALCVMAGEQLLKGGPLRRTLRLALAGPGFIGLFAIACHPLFYLRNTLEGYGRARIEDIVLAELDAQGYEELLPTMRSPKVAFAYAATGYYRPMKRPSFSLTRPNALIGGGIDLPLSERRDLEVTIWARGSIGDSRPTLGVGLCDMNTSDPIAPPPECVRARVEITDEIDVYRVRIPARPQEGRRQFLFVTLLGADLNASELFHRLRRPRAEAAIYGIYYRFPDCRREEVVRRPVELPWRPLQQIEIQPLPDGLRLHPLGDDPQLAVAPPLETSDDAQTLRLLIDVERDMVLQWFLDAGQGYSEQLSKRCPVVAGPVTLLIPLPLGVKDLRLDVDADAVIRGSELISSRWVPR